MISAFLSGSKYGLPGILGEKKSEGDYLARFDFVCELDLFTVKCKDIKIFKRSSHNS